MPYALCPMPYARRVPHVTEKGYIYFLSLIALNPLRFFSQLVTPGVTPINVTNLCNHFLIKPF